MSTTSTSSLHCTFRVAGLDFGVAVEDVQEVLRHQEMTPVPRPPEAVRGLINLRGQIVIALDLRLRLGLPARAADERPMNVIVRNRSEEHTSELQSLMRISYVVFCLKKKKTHK